MWHAKGDGITEGLQDLDPLWTEDYSFSKTQAVVLNLLKQDGISCDSMHIVWLDNLFVSEELLSQLYEEGFGAAGTVRTQKTAREEVKAIHGTKKQKAKAAKAKNRGLPDCLSDLKLQHAAQIPWGDLYATKSANGHVLMVAWKDQNVVLFITTVDRPDKTVIRPRRRPAKTATNARTSRVIFAENEHVKPLPIPLFIDRYNHYMNGVDVTDQLRSYYTTQRVHLKN